MSRELLEKIRATIARPEDSIASMYCYYVGDIDELLVAIKESLEKPVNVFSSTAEAYEAGRLSAKIEAIEACHKYWDSLGALGEDEYDTGKGRGALDCVKEIEKL